MAQNDFSKHMAAAFGFAGEHMGDDIRLNGVPARAITMRVQKTSAAATQGGGRVVGITGAMEVSLDDWRASGARQGALLEHPVYGRMKITNTPNEALSVVTLEVAGAAQ